jgi:hypothetical protein
MKHLALFTLLLCGSASAQKVNTDSLNLVSKISADQLKLGKLQNQVEEYTRDKKNAAEQAQKSASDNADAASKLSSNPQDKTLARRADNSASTARSDAKKARRAASRLDDLMKEIGDTKDKIAQEQAKLGKWAQPAAAQVPVIVQQPAPQQVPPVDTTKHQ